MLGGSLGGILGFVQIFFAIVIGVYFWNLLKNQRGTKVAVQKESKVELEKLREMRSIRLSEPLTSKTRPKDFSDIIGQAEGIKALQAALCGPNPQHVIIYGSPGVGKTAAARLVLEAAKKSRFSPFKENAKFTEVDGATARFDERGIADPLIGSVHDPIYQGAGAMGMAGIPQPKIGAVTKAHGGILFIDEIGELHPVQINKLLKVLEDRKVILESAYYSSEDSNIPSHIHDIFQNGLPADFRMVAATTRSPREIPPAIRSRCLEIFFRDLLPEEIGKIALNTAKNVDFTIEDDALEVIKVYCTNGREVVNMVQIAVGLGLAKDRTVINKNDVQWVVNNGQYSPRPDKKIALKPQIGLVNGLAVYGANMGMLNEIEVSVMKSKTAGKIVVTGIVEEEELSPMAGQKIRRKSMAKNSVENVLTVLRQSLNLDTSALDIHVNFPGGTPTDGPSAGIAIATAIYSAIKGIAIDNKIAMTGELSLRGDVLPIGGVIAKVEGAKQAGAELVIIPKDNWQEMFSEIEGINVIAVESFKEVLELALVEEETVNQVYNSTKVVLSS